MSKSRRLPCDDVRFVEVELPRQRRVKLHAEALQLLIDGVDLRGATFKPWYERAD
jgi:hypothetical protein